MKRKYLKNWTGYVLLMTVLVISFQNCSPEHSDGSLTDLGSTGVDPAEYQALENQVASIFNSRCVSCHSSLVGSSNLPYLNSVSNLKFDQIYVKRGSPQTSAVYLSIIDGSMPPGQNLVTSAPAEVSAIRDWIQYMP